MPKRLTSIRISDYTTAQLHQLAALYETNQSDLIMLAIDRMYRDAIGGNPIKKAERKMSASNPTPDEAFEMAKLVFDAVYPDRKSERDLDKVAEIEEWLSAPGGWADYADPNSLAVEWRMVEAEAERIYPKTK